MSNTRPDSSQVVFVPSGVGTVATTVQEKLRESVSVLDFGAVGDGEADDTDAIKKAIVYAGAVVVGSSLGNPQINIHFPAGIYLVGDGVLNTPAYRLGCHFTGDGMFSSTLKMKPVVSPSYIVNNLTFTDGSAFMLMENLGFLAGDMEDILSGVQFPNANFARMYSSGITQGMKFVNCCIQGFQDVMRCEGTNTASEVRWINCKINYTWGNVLYIDNLQSLNHNYIGCDLEVNRGPLFKTGPNGGGTIHAYGGSWILFSGGVVFDVGGVLSGPNSINGVRFELRGTTSKLFTGNTGAYTNIVFNSCTIYTTDASGTRDIVTWKNAQQIIFNNCQFDSNGSIGTFRCTSTTAELGWSGSLKFVDCTAHYRLCERITFDSSYGHASGRGMLSTSYGAIPTTPTTYALDFDIGGSTSVPYGTAGGAGGAGVVTKKVFFKELSAAWPRKSSVSGLSIVEKTVRLPVGAIIKSIVLREAASGTSTANLQYQITNDDKTVVHALSNLAQQQLAHTVTLNDYFYPVGLTDNERTIRISIDPAVTATGADQVKSGGFGYIEYL